MKQKGGKMSNNMRAKFYFEKRGDQYTLTGWKNVMSAGDIEKKYGKKVLTDYWDNSIDDGFIQSIDSSIDAYSEHSLFCIDINETFSEKDYQQLIKSMKNAGERLSNLIKESRKPEKITITI